MSSKIRLVLERATETTVTEGYKKIRHAEFTKHIPLSEGFHRGDQIQVKIVVKRNRDDYKLYKESVDLGKWEGAPIVTEFDGWVPFVGADATVYISGARGQKERRLGSFGLTDLRDGAKAKAKPGQDKAEDEATPKTMDCYALVIGNNYPGEKDNQLHSCINDANRMGKALQNVGFKVDVKKDLDKTRLRDALKEFCAKVDAAARGAKRIKDGQERSRPDSKEVMYESLTSWRVR